jgi:hypothetical protein
MDECMALNQKIDIDSASGYRIFEFKTTVGSTRGIRQMSRKENSIHYHLTWQKEQG